MTPEAEAAHRPLTAEEQVALIRKSLDEGLILDRFVGSVPIFHRRAEAEPLAAIYARLAAPSAPSSGDLPESGPSFARFTATDTPEDLERKMADAFAPLRAARLASQPDRAEPDRAPKDDAR